MLVIWQRERGFSILELAVSVIVMLLLVGVALSRFERVAEQTERARFYSNLGQLNSLLRSREAKAYIEGNRGELVKLAGTNPLEWSQAQKTTLKVPDIQLTLSGYGGTISEKQLDQSEPLVGERWYFVTERGWLVYKAARYGRLKQQGRADGIIRYRVTTVMDPQQQNAALVLKPVTPFSWEP